MTLGPVVWVVLAEIFPTRILGRGHVHFDGGVVDRLLYRLTDVSNHG